VGICIFTGLGYVALSLASDRLNDSECTKDPTNFFAIRCPKYCNCKSIGAVKINTCEGEINHQVAAFYRAVPTAVQSVLPVITFIGILPLTVIQQ